jgi:hypothetical protein
MTVVNIVLLALTVASGLIALFFLLSGIQQRATQDSNPYGVAKQEARHTMQVSFLRAGFMILLTLIFLAVYSLVPGAETAETAITPTPDSPQSQPTVASTVAATDTPARQPTPSAEPTRVEPTVTISSTQTVTATQTAEPSLTPAEPTAVVNSPNGLWLREAPGGTQEVELIAHDTELVLLAGRETAEDVEWQQVRSPAGNEGWVAVEFLTYQ